jgi:hypothetical protein
MPDDIGAAGPTWLDLAEPDEWDLDVRLGELGTVLCGCGDHELFQFVPTGGGATCNTQNDTCPATCKGATCTPTCTPTCHATCPDTCRQTCDHCGPTDFPTCNNTHCNTCRSGCRIP